MNKKSTTLKPNILFCTPYLNFPPKGGPELRSLNSIKALVGISNLTVIHIVQFEKDVNFLLINELDRLGVINYSLIVLPKNQVFISANFHGIGKFFARSANFVFRILSLYNLRKYRYLANRLSKIVSKDNNDIFWISFANLYVPLISKIRKENPNLSIISDTDSVWSEFILRSIPYKPHLRRIFSKFQGEHKKLQERKMIKLSTIVTAVSEVDQLQYQKMTSEPTKIFCAYNVIDLDLYKADKPQNYKSENKIVLLTGSFGQKYSPMDQGAKWFIDSVWPLIRLKEPNAILKLVGKGSENLWETNSQSGIFVFGKVESIDVFMTEATVSIVPLWFESGTRFKILESAAFATPVVTTTLGVEGLLVTECSDISIADTAIDFANGVLGFIEKKSSSKFNQSLFSIVSSKYCIKNLEAQSSTIISSLNLSRK